MVNDPRVSSCLARLGGVYNDPVRVDRDAASLLKSPVGTNLIPIVAELYESRTRGSTGNAANVLVLQGTIAIHFKGQTYQILMDIYLPAGFVSTPNAASAVCHGTLLVLFVFISILMTAQSSSNPVCSIGA